MPGICTVLKGNFGCVVENVDLLPEFFVVVYPDIIHSIDINKVATDLAVKNSKKYKSKSIK